MFNGSVLKKARKKKGLSHGALADILDVSRVSITHYENGTNSPTAESIEKISKVLGVSVAELFGEVEDIFFVPLIGKASCGAPQEYDLNGYEPVPVAGKIYSHGMYAVEAEGDSMSPKINNGDIVYCNPNVQVENGNIVHYSYNDESGIKKYKVNEAGTIISLIPINPEYDIITIDEFGFGSLKMAKVVGSVDMNY